MKSQLSLLFLLTTGFAAACTSSEGKFIAAGSGGVTSSGGAGAGGTTVQTPEAGVVIPKDFSEAEDGGTNLVASELFGDLSKQSYYDPNDPCSAAIPWITGVNKDVNIVDGSLVQSQGKVYKYDVSGGGVSNCNKAITSMYAGCAPSAPDAWCEKCWILQDTVCPIIDITVIPDVVSDAGTEEETDAG